VRVDGRRGSASRRRCRAPVPPPFLVHSHMLRHEAVSPFGKSIVKRGPQEIEEYYQAGFKMLKDRHVDIKLDEASQIRPDTAIAAGSFVVTGKADNGDPVKMEGHWTGVYVLDGGAWKVRMGTVFPNPPPPK
jgi:ketosteroid isomerase-like protein